MIAAAILDPDFAREPSRPYDGESTIFGKRGINYLRYFMSAKSPKRRMDHSVSGERVTTVWPLMTMMVDNNRSPGTCRQLLEIQATGASPNHGAAAVQADRLDPDLKYVE